MFCKCIKRNNKFVSCLLGRLLVGWMPVRPFVQSAIIMSVRLCPFGHYIRRWKLMSVWSGVCWPSVRKPMISWVKWSNNSCCFHCFHETLPMYRRDNSCLFFFRAEDCCFSLEDFSGAFRNKGKLVFLKISVIGRSFPDILSATYFSHCTSPICFADLMELTTVASIIRVVSRVNSSVVYSKNGFPYS